MGATEKHSTKTKPTMGQVVNAERNLDREALIQEALASVEKVSVKELIKARQKALKAKKARAK